MQAFNLSTFMCFASSSLMFGQDVKHGFLVYRLCWPYRVRGSGGPDLLRDRVMIGATVLVHTLKEWKLPSVSL